MKILKLKEQKKLLEELKSTYGITKINGFIIQFGEGKYRIYSGGLQENSLIVLDKTVKIENCGLYFAKEENDGIRLTLDGIQLLKDQINNNILELTDEQAIEWLKGNELYIESDKSYKILKNNNEFIGCGKSTGTKIANFVPKERRIK